MRLSFDPAKNERNIALRGIPFTAAEAFDWSSAWVVEDVRKDYGERRFQAMGLIDDRVHVLVFTPRDGAVHVISLRKANAREVKRYEAQSS